MVLSLAVPNFPTYQRRNLSRTVSASSTVAEALRTNPFGTSRLKRCASASLEEEQFERERKARNESLATLASLFPDIKPEVFREILIRFDGLSSLQICVEQLLRNRQEWTKGRWNVPPRDQDADVAIEDTFRRESYKTAVNATLYQEFRSLSRSVIDAVLAENNFSYTRTRPVLRDLSKRSWRIFLPSLNIFRKKKETEVHPSLMFQRDVHGALSPNLKETGCTELDEELADMLIVPVMLSRKEEQENKDLDLAASLNKEEAEAANAIYECDCCCSDTTFESMSTCSAQGHIICFGCIRRTIHEALFGQGWGKSMDHERGTLKCLSPLVDATCDGCLDQDLVKRAIVSEKAGYETYAKLEERIAAESLAKSQMQLVRCVFCSYAEADPIYHPANPKHRLWQIKRGNLVPTLFTVFLLLDLIPILIIPVLLLLLVAPSYSTTLWRNSLRSLALKRRSPRFTCANPACARRTCLTCHKSWHDPHVCHEPLLLSLRTSVEAARTAAVKRTCPRCGLSFVKSSGCNKLTCVCGYAMCYLCRKALGPTGTRARGDNQQEEEGYRHFCEHFRVNPGGPCTECNKCDLYRTEDEEAIVRRAGEQAEREWRVKEGMIGAEGLDNYLGDGNGGSDRVWDRFLDGRWSVQGLADWALEQLIVIDV